MPNFYNAKGPWSRYVEVFLILDDKKVIRWRETKLVVEMSKSKPRARKGLLGN